MRLTGFELKKSMVSLFIWVVWAVVIGLNIFSILTGGSQDEYAANAPAFRTDIQRIKDQRSYFAGPITQEWIDRYQREAEDILRDPQYRVSDEDAEEIIARQMARGYTEEAVKDSLYLFLNENGSLEYDKYEDVQFASQFYSNALRFGENMAEYYLETFPGEKGAALAADTRARYQSLATKYTAHYNYDYGYQKVRNMMTIYPYTIGVMILIALAPVFSSEYARKTDALLLSSRDGKKRLAHAKIGAGLLTALAAWGIITALNLTIIVTVYGTTGWEAFWQNWVIDVAPFPWNQGQITVIAVMTSLLGSLFFALVVMLISTLSKNQFIAIVVGAAVLLFPMFDFAFTNNYFVNMLYNFLPTRIMMGIRIWQGYDLLYFAGRTFPYQYAAIAFAVICSICVCPLAVHFFTSHQAEN